MLACRDTKFMNYYIITLLVQQEIIDMDIGPAGSTYFSIGDRHCYGPAGSTQFKGR